jgi:hypothetical protein
MAELEQCTAEQVVDVVEAVVLAGAPTTAATVADHVTLPQPSVERALAVAVKLGLVEQQDTSFIAIPPYAHYFAEASEPRRIDVLRIALEAFGPYGHFKGRLAFHGDAQKAARETKLRFGYTNHEAEIRETLVSLGQFAGSLSYSTDGGLAVVRSDPADEFLGTAEAITLERASIDEFIREKLGDAAYTYVQDEQADIITHLRAAMAKVVAGELDESLVLEVANATENFLVKLAGDQSPPVNLATKHGVLAKAQALKNTALATKHLGFMTYIGHIRNAADHGIDPEIGLEWDITPDSARLSVFVLLSGIKSIVAFKEGRAEY